MEQIVPQAQLAECGTLASLCRGRLLVLRNGAGWIRPLQEIDHPASTWNRGNIYLDVKDIRPNVKLQCGDLVVFHLYVDRKGLGAEDCFSVRDPCMEAGFLFASEEASWSADKRSSWNKEASQNWANYQCESELQQVKLGTIGGAASSVSEIVASPLELLRLYEDDSDTDDDFYSPSKTKAGASVSNPLDLLAFYEDDSDTDDDFYGPSNVKMNFCEKDGPCKSKEECSTSEGEDVLVTTGSSSEGSDDEGLSEAEDMEKKPFRNPPGLPQLPGAVPANTSFRHPPGLPLVPGPVSSSIGLCPTVPQPLNKLLPKSPVLPLKPGLVCLNEIQAKMISNSSSDIGDFEASSLAAETHVKQFRFPPGLPHPPGQLVSAA